MIGVSSDLLTHPKTRMFVSKTDTTTSLSNDTSFITSLTACSNSSKSPNTTKESRVSISVSEKLEQKGETKIKAEAHVKYILFGDRSGRNSYERSLARD
jgi:hypothetical protein